MSIHPLPSRTIDPVQQAKIHFAAAHRLAVLHELEEGIDNHFTVTVPGREDRYLILPFGLHWSEARASDMIVFDESGKTLEGEGVVELSAQCIHAPIHRITGAARNAGLRSSSIGMQTREPRPRGTAIRQAPNNADLGQRPTLPGRRRKAVQSIKQ